MRTFFVIIIICVWAASGAYAQQLPAYEMPRTQVAPITDRQEDRQYELIVKLPDSYAEDTDRKFPVIYTTDAVWHMDMLSGATEYLMPDVILVGVSWQKDLGFERPHDSRFRDYSFVPFSNPETQAKYQGGKAGEHLDFFRKDVFPYVEKNYRADPNDRTLFGYSLGGDFSAFVALAAPKTFKYYIIGSPSVSQKEVDFLGAGQPLVRLRFFQPANTGTQVRRIVFNQMQIRVAPNLQLLNTPEIGGSGTAIGAVDHIPLFQQ